MIAKWPQPVEISIDSHGDKKKTSGKKSINPKIDIGQELSILLFIFFILIIFAHRKNIYKLKNKTEQKIKI